MGLIGLELNDSGILAAGGSPPKLLDLDGQEQLIVAQEVGRNLQELPVDEIFAAIRRAVWEEHEVSCRAVLLLRTGGLPKTSSGKVQRPGL